MTISAQDRNASSIVLTVETVMKQPHRVAVLAVMTAMTESNLMNDANRNVPASFSLPHDGMGTDHASLGVFQQQTGTAWSDASTMDTPNGWGTPAQLMSVPVATRKFVRALLSHTGWENLSNGAACQLVQGSAFPDRYAVNESRAVQIVNQYWRTDVTPAELATELSVFRAHLQDDLANALQAMRTGRDHGHFTHERYANLVDAKGGLSAEIARRP